MPRFKITGQIDVGDLDFKLHARGYIALAQRAHECMQFIQEGDGVWLCLRIPYIREVLWLHKNHRNPSRWTGNRRHLCTCRPNVDSAEESDKQEDESVHNFCPYCALHLSIVPYKVVIAVR